MRVDGLCHNLFERPAAARPADLAHRARRAAVAGPRQGAAAARAPLRCSTFLVTSLALPGLDDLGHVPPCRRPRPRAAGDLGAAARSTRSSRGWACGAAGRDPVAWLGATLGVFGVGRCSRSALLPAFGGGSRSRPTVYAALDARLAALGHPLDAPAGHPRLPDLARGDVAPADARAARRIADGRRRPRESTSARAGSCRRSPTTARGPSRGRERRRAPTASRRSRWPRRRPGRRRRPRVDPRVRPACIPESRSCPVSDQTRPYTRAADGERRDRQYALRRAARGGEGGPRVQREHATHHPRPVSRGIRRGARPLAGPARRAAYAGTRGPTAAAVPTGDGDATRPPSPRSRAPTTRVCGRSARTSTRAGAGLGAAPGRAVAAGARPAQPREHVAVPRARRRHA